MTKRTVVGRRRGLRDRYRGLQRLFKATSERKRPRRDLGKWWHEKKRSFRYVRQRFKPYVIVVLASTALIALPVLWASGVFGQLRETIAQSSGDMLVAAGFSVNHVSIAGRRYTSKEGLYEVLAVSQGESLLNYDLNRARQRIEVLDWVREAHVMRLWPDSLHVEIVEHRPAAIWQLNGQLALIDRDGQIISSEHLSNFANLIHVVGQGAAEEAAGLIDLLNRYPAIRSRVRSAIRVSGRRWNLRLDSGIDIKLPDNREEEALHRLLVLDDRHRLLVRDIATIDLRLPDRMFIGLRSNEMISLNVPGMDT